MQLNSPLVYGEYPHARRGRLEQLQLIYSIPEYIDLAVCRVYIDLAVSRLSKGHILFPSMKSVHMKL